MTWRHLAFAILLGFLNTFPLHGASPGVDPCHILTEGLQRLEAENMIYRVYYFPPPGALQQPDQQAQLMASGPPSRSQQPDTRWSVSGGLEAGYTVFQVKGTDFDRCSDLLEQVVPAAKEGLFGSGLAWQVEAFLPGDAGDLSRLGRELVESLGGTLHSSADYNGSYHLLAFVPWDSGSLLLNECPVNLNLELFADPLKNGVRLRAGVPVLLSLSHFPE